MSYTHTWQKQTRKNNSENVINVSGGTTKLFQLSHFNRILQQLSPPPVNNNNLSAGNAVILNSLSLLRNLHHNTARHLSHQGHMLRTCARRLDWPTLCPVLCGCWSLLEVTYKLWGPASNREHEHNTNTKNIKESQTGALTNHFPHKILYIHIHTHKHTHTRILPQKLTSINKHMICSFSCYK